MSVPLVLSHVALWILVLLQSLVLLGLVRIVHQLQQAGIHPTSSVGTSNGQLTGRDAPRFAAVDVNGTEVDSSAFRAPLTALLFVSPTCESCTVTLDDMMGQLVLKTDGNVIVVCRGGHEECSGLAQSSGITVPVVADEQFEIGQLFEISAVPSAVLINAHNKIQSRGRPMGSDELESLVEEREHAGQEGAH